jgi:4-hydroxybenzoate polyprenyltransferase
MRFRKRRGTALSLLLASHPVAAMTFAAVMTAAAALSGRPAEECALVAATVLLGQLTVGWVDDVADRHRDRQVGRQDRPVAMEWIDAGTVTLATACATLVVVPLAVSNGTWAGVSYLGAIVSLWLYHVWLKRSWLSWLPYVVAFALLPAFLSYGGMGGGMHGGPPTYELTVLAALLGLGVHFARALPDLVEDKETGVRHLPLRVALRIGAPKLLWVTSAYLVLVVAGLVLAAATRGLRQ